LTRVARRAGGGELVVLLHGAGADHRIFQAIIDVAPTRFTAFAPDLRGHGDGARGPFSLAAIVDDLLALLDELGFAHAHWVGVELGGVVAQLLAKRHPERVLSLVLASTFAHYGAAAGQRALSREPAGPRREILRALYAVDLREALDDVTVPVLVLGGEDDDVVPPAPYLHTLATGLHAPCVRVLPGLGHLGSAQHGDALAAATWAFLRTLPGPGADEGACFASPPECAGAAPEAIGQAAALLSVARHPVVVSEGLGAFAGGPAALGRLAQRAALPVYEGPPRRFVDLPSEHHAHHGLASAKVLHGADLVLLVGDAQMPQMEANLPHIRVGLRADAAATQSLVGDPVVTLRALATAFDALVDGPLAAQLAGRREVLAERREAARRELAAALHADADAELVTLRLLGHTLAALLPPDRLSCNEFVADPSFSEGYESGTHFGFGHAPRGAALAFARAKKRALPERTVVVLGSALGPAGPEAVLQIAANPEPDEAPPGALRVEHPSELVRCLEQSLGLVAAGTPVSVVVRLEG
jgi:pimeloyl-ACP methyl ester carboxylesterase